MIKLVTVLFADVVGSTSHAERMPPEDVRAHMADFLEAMSEEITAEGGTVERYVGDAIMADFGVPVAHEDDPLRAVKAARRMLKRLEEWNQGREPRSRIQVRIGINTGEVSTGGTFGEQLMVMGDSVNVAARLQQAAEPGTIIVGERTARFVRDSFELTKLEPLALKGKAEASAAFVVGDELAETDVRAISEFAGPMVGRAAELRLLEASFEKVAREGTPLLVSVIGDPGVGKSRLVAEFLRTMDGRARVIAGRCISYGEGVTLWPFREILRAEAGIIGSDPPDVAIENVTKLARSLATDAHQQPEGVTAAFISTLGIEQPGELRGLDPREVHRELLRAWRALLIDRARERPLVVLVEDLHWADEATLGVLEDVVGNAAAPILFLCPARPELTSFRAEWIGGLKYYTALPLGSLDLASSTQLVSELLDLEQVPEELWSRVLKKAEGNPFFLEEIVRHLADQGHLVPSNGRWKTGSEVEEVDIPDNVQAVILSRIDLLPSSEKDVIQKAAVVGRTFWPVLLQQLTANDDIDQAIRSLKSRQLISERPISSLAGETEYAFKHILIRDVAYESLPRQARGDAHAAVAQWIEATRGPRADEVAEILAHHFDQAFKWLGDDELRRRARFCYLAAARNAVRAFAIRAAEGFGVRAVELSAEGKERIEALEALGDLYMLTNQGDGAWQAFTTAVSEILEHVTDKAALARTAAKAAIVATRYEPTMEDPVAEKEILRIISLGLEGAGEEDKDRAMLLAADAFIRRSGTREGITAEANGRTALAIAERLDDPDLISITTDALAYALLTEFKFHELERLQKRRLDLVPRLEDLTEVCDVYGSAAYTAVFVGRYAEAEGHASSCIEKARGIDPGAYVHALIWRAHARFMRGDWDGALADQAEVQDLQRHEGSEDSGSLAMRAHGVAMFCHQLRGDSAKADEHLEHLRRFRAKAGNDPTLAGPFALPARALAHRGELDEAHEWLCLEKALYLPGHLEAACEVLADKQDWEGARRVIELASSEVPAGELASLPHFIERLQGRMAASSGDTESAQRLLQKSADGFSRLGTPWEEAWSKLLLGELLVEMGESKRAEYVAASALECFRRLSSVSEIERSEKVLAELG